MRVGHQPMVFEYIIRYSPRRRASHSVAEGFSPTASPAYRMNVSKTITSGDGETRFPHSPAGRGRGETRFPHTPAPAAYFHVSHPRGCAAHGRDAKEGYAQHFQISRPCGSAAHRRDEHPSWEGAALPNPPRGRGLGARASGPRPLRYGETRFPHPPRRGLIFTLGDGETRFPHPPARGLRPPKKNLFSSSWCAAQPHGRLP